MWNHVIATTTAELGYWTAQSKYSDTELVDAGAADIGVSFCTISWTRTVPTGLREDLVTCTIAIAKDPGTQAYSDIIAADKATVEGLLDTWWTSYKALASSQFTLAEYRWHDYHMSDLGVLGPADRVTARAVAGSVATNRIPDQDAFSLTFQTASRKHWGRIYLPGLGISRLDTAYGRWTTGTVDNVVLYWHTFLAGLASADLEQVVASKRYQGILSLAQLSADDIPDIQRRRRAKQALYHKTYTS